jgi:hypothetical protein
MTELTVLYYLLVDSTHSFFLRMQGLASRSFADAKYLWTLTPTVKRALIGTRHDIGETLYQLLVHT